MGGLKRKRIYGPSKAVTLAVVKARPGKRRKQFTPGKDRVGGFYGRYSNGGELKFHDVDLDDAVVASGGTVVASINLIAQGVTESTRVGRKCTIKSINWKYRFTLGEQDAVATPATADTLRIIMFIDKQANGATAAVTDLLESADVHSFRNLANSGRFVFLLDKVIPLNWRTLASDNAAVVSSAGVFYEQSFYKKCNLPVEFSATTGAITEIRSNNIGVLLLSFGGTPGFVSKIRLRFSDN